MASGEKQPQTRRTVRLRNMTLLMMQNVSQASNVGLCASYPVASTILQLVCGFVGPALKSMTDTDDVYAHWSFTVVARLLYNGPPVLCTRDVFAAEIEAAVRAFHAAQTEEADTFVTSALSALFTGNTGQAIALALQLGQDCAGACLADVCMPLVYTMFHVLHLLI